MNLIKTYAKQVIKQYQLTYPLNINLLIKLLNFNVKYLDTGKCDGYTVIYKGKKQILLSENIPNNRIRFTLAHELGHYFIPDHLESIYACNVNEIVNSRDLNDKNVEKEADIFAAELLVPSSEVKKTSYVQTIDDIRKIASYYQVSIQVAAIKMIEYTDDIVCFICCRNDKVEWFVASEDFKANFRLHDITRTIVPKDSFYFKAKQTPKGKLRGRVLASLWLEDIGDNIYIIEETYYVGDFNLGYILIKADNLIDDD